MRNYSLVDVMHHLHDKLGAPFCFEKNTINKKVPLWISWVAPLNDIHPRKAAMIAIANEELQVLEEAQFTTRVEVTREGFILISPNWIPHTHVRAHVSLLGKQGGSETLTYVYTPLRCQRKWANSLCGCGRDVPTFYQSCRRLPPSRFGV